MTTGIAGTFWCAQLVLRAYVLMRNHYYLLVETPQANLSRVFAELGSAYTRASIGAPPHCGDEA